MAEFLIPPATARWRISPALWTRSSAPSTHKRPSPSKTRIARRASRCAFASASTSGTSSSTVRICSVTASTSPLDWRRWLSPAGFACPVRCVIRSARGCRSRSSRSVSSGSRTSPNQCEPTRSAPDRTGGRRQQPPAPDGRRSARASSVRRWLDCCSLPSRAALGGNGRPGSSFQMRIWRRRRRQPV